MSVSDVARCNDRSFKDNGYGIEGYQLKPNLRFNFSRNHKVPPGDLKMYLDVIIAEKKKIPAPNQYSNTQHSKHFNDLTKKSVIYTNDRKSAI